jgi:hypothetical protein
MPEIGPVWIVDARAGTQDVDMSEFGNSDAEHTG